MPCMRNLWAAAECMTTVLALWFHVSIFPRALGWLSSVLRGGGQMTYTLPGAVSLSLRTARPRLIIDFPFDQNESGKKDRLCDAPVACGLWVVSPYSIPHTRAAMRNARLMRAHLQEAACRWTTTRGRQTPQPCSGSCEGRRTPRAEPLTLTLRGRGHEQL
eukprot:scaffold55343_cov37-Tisochrysis_lutea.AAC.5